MSVTALPVKRVRLTAQTPVRFTDAEMERLDEMAEEHEMPRAHIIRAAVLALFEQIDAEQATKKKRKKK